MLIQPFVFAKHGIGAGEDGEEASGLRDYQQVTLKGISSTRWFCCSERIANYHGKGIFYQSPGTGAISETDNFVSDSVLSAGHPFAAYFIKSLGEFIWECL